MFLLDVLHITRRGAISFIRRLASLILCATPLFSHAGLTFTIHKFTSDELSISISGTLDADVTGGQRGWLAIKGAWSTNVGRHTEFLTAMPTVTVNTITIGGRASTSCNPCIVWDASTTWGDSIYFTNPDGQFETIRAGTVVSGSIVLSATGAFNPLARLELLSGFNNSLMDWVRLEAPGTPDGTVLITLSKNGTGAGTVVSADGNINCGNTCGALVATDSRVKLTAVADPGSMFVGWGRTGCALSKPCSFPASKSEVVTATFVPKPLSTAAKIIYVGVCGAGYLFDDTCLAAQGWYDPRDVGALSGFNPLNDSDLNIVAANYSGLDAIGLRVGRLFPSSVTLVTGFSVASVYGDLNPFGIRNNVPSIVDFVATVYRPGDKVYLVGHSSGGGIIQDVAFELRSRRIPVQLTAQIDSIGLDAKVADNVVRAMNFFYPRHSLLECTIAGENNILPSKPGKQATVITNLSIDNPVGPETAGASCRFHKNMDNDQRVWTPIMEFISSGR